MSVDLERELGARLHRRGSVAPVGDGWEAIHRRIEARRRARQRRRVAGCSLAVAVTVVASVALLGDSDREARVATRPPDLAAGRPELPRLVLDLPGWELERADADAGGGGRAEASPLWVFTEPGGGYDGKVVFVSVVDPTAPFGIGEDSPTATVVDVRGQRAYLNFSAPLAGQLGWRLTDGTAVYLTSVRLTGDELIAFARALNVGSDREVLLPEGPLPGGLTLRRRTAPEEWDPRASATLAYRRGSARVELWLQTGGEWVFDDLVRDRLSSAAAGNAAVVDGDRQGVVTTYHGPGRNHAVIWPARPGTVAEVRTEGVSAEDALAAARSVREIDAATWSELVRRSRTTVPPPAGGSEAGPERYEEVRSALCELRAAWLAGGDRAEVGSRGRELRNAAVAEHLDRDSDIVAVLDDLLDAMRAGDEEGVRSIPAGGCP